MEMNTATINDELNPEVMETEELNTECENEVSDENNNISSAVDMPIDKDFIGQTSDFIGPEDYDTVKLLSLKSKVNDLTKLTEQLKSKQNNMINDDEGAGDYLDEAIADYTVDELKALTNDELDDIYTYNDTAIEFQTDFDSEKQRYEFQRDYLVMRKETITAISKFDEESAKINAELAEHQAELDHLLDTYGDMEGMIRSKLDSKIENATDDYERELYTNMRTSFEYAFNLDNVIAYVKSYRGRSIISDYRDAKKSNKVYRHYLKVIESLGITTNLTGFRNLEKNFLVVDDNLIYNKRPNIFVFSVIHYISSWYNKEYSKVDGLFITQFIINLKNLFYDKFSDEEVKEKFIDRIKTVIDIIG